MADVASRELRNNTRSVIDRARAGEEVWITVDGIQVAQLVPKQRGQRWVPRQVAIDIVTTAAADAGLHQVLRDLNPETTDDE